MHKALTELIRPSKLRILNANVLSDVNASPAPRIHFSCPLHALFCLDSWPGISTFRKDIPCFFVNAVKDMEEPHPTLCLPCE
jgi:hypothetical protein